MEKEANNQLIQRLLGRKITGTCFDQIHEKNNKKLWSWDLFTMN